MPETPPPPLPSTQGVMYNRVKTCFKVSRLQKRKDETPTSVGVSKECCDTILVLSTLSGKLSWQNDITSCWAKKQDTADIVEIKLYNDNDVLANYQPSVIACKKDPLAHYATIKWQDVLNNSADGVGCYRIKVKTKINGIDNEFEWGHYDLKIYSPENASNTVRIRSVFNQYHKIEDIDFTLTEVQDTIRFRGFFGKRQTNTIIDNLIYQGKVEKNVQRENLNTYELNTDPLNTWYIDNLLDLHLLSETEIYLTDHNEFNTTYGYKDIPLIVKESPEVEYRDFSRLASVKCKFSDKTKNAYSKYNG